jgi:hypothetical protein
VPDFELVDVIYSLVQYPLAEVEEQLTEPSRFIDVATGDYPKYDLFTYLIVAARGSVYHDIDSNPKEIRSSIVSDCSKMRLLT